MLPYFAENCLELFMKEWIDKGRSFVAIEAKAGEVIGHVAIEEWPHCLEIRSVVTAPGFRNMGVNTRLTEFVVNKMFEGYPDAVLMELKSETSNGHTLLMNAIGFIEVPLSELQLLGGAIRNPGPRWHLYTLTLGQYKAYLLKAQERDPNGRK